MDKRIKWITQTAIMLALLIVLQTLTKALGQFVTGSCVNFVLSITVLLCGLVSGITVAILSPFFAFFLGIGPAFLPIVPGIALGNIVIVLLLWLLLGKGDISIKLPKKVLAIIVASVAKFAVLFIVVTKLILPLLGLKEKQVMAITASFSYPQLVTAIIGSTLAVILWPRVKKIVK